MAEQAGESKADREGRGDSRKAVIKTLKSQDLFQGARELGIDHHGALYRLKITRQGKLILNK